MTRYSPIAASYAGTSGAVSRGPAGTITGTQTPDRAGTERRELDVRTKLASLSDARLVARFTRRLPSSAFLFGRLQPDVARYDVKFPYYAIQGGAPTAELAAYLRNEVDFGTQEILVGSGGMSDQIELVPAGLFSTVRRFFMKALPWIRLASQLGLLPIPPRLLGAVSGALDRIRQLTSQVDFQRLGALAKTLRDAATSVSQGELNGYLGNLASAVAVGNNIQVFNLKHIVNRATSSIWTNYIGGEHGAYAEVAGGVIEDLLSAYAPLSIAHQKFYTASSIHFDHTEGIDILRTIAVQKLARGEGAAQASFIKLDALPSMGAVLGRFGRERADMQRDLLLPANELTTLLYPTFEAELAGRPGGDEDKIQDRVNRMLDESGLRATATEDMLRNADAIARIEFWDDAVHRRAIGSAMGNEIPHALAVFGEPLRRALWPRAFDVVMEHVPPDSFLREAPELLVGQGNYDSPIDAYRAMRDAWYGDGRIGLLQFENRLSGRFFDAWVMRIATYLDLGRPDMAGDAIDEYAEGWGSRVVDAIIGRRGIVVPDNLGEIEMDLNLGNNANSIVDSGKKAADRAQQLVTDVKSAADVAKSVADVLSSLAGIERELATFLPRISAIAVQRDIGGHVFAEAAGVAVREIGRNVQSVKDAARVAQDWASRSDLAAATSSVAFAMSAADEAHYWAYALRDWLDEWDARHAFPGTPFRGVGLYADPFAVFEYDAARRAALEASAQADQDRLRQQAARNAEARNRAQLAVQAARNAVGIATSAISGATAAVNRTAAGSSARQALEAAQGIVVRATALVEEAERLLASNNVANWGLAETRATEAGTLIAQARDVADSAKRQATAIGGIEFAPQQQWSTGGGVIRGQPEMGVDERRDTPPGGTGTGEPAQGGGLDFGGEPGGGERISNEGEAAGGKNGSTGWGVPLGMAALLTGGYYIGRSRKWW